MVLLPKTNKYTDMFVYAWKTLKTRHWLLLGKLIYIVYIPFCIVWTCMFLNMFTFKSHLSPNTYTFVGHLLHSRSIPDIMDITMNDILLTSSSFRMDAVILKKIAFTSTQDTTLPHCVGNLWDASYKTETHMNTVKCLQPILLIVNIKGLRNSKISHSTNIMIQLTYQVN